MTTARSTERPETWDWRQLANLGEQLRNEDSLGAQRDRIAGMTGGLIVGKVDVWLNENFFCLPDWEDGRVFPLQPTLDGMKLAIKAGKLFAQTGKVKKDSASHPTFASIPLIDHGITLGRFKSPAPSVPPFLLKS